MVNKQIIEINNTYEGFRFIVVLLGVGHRCGYINIPKEHALFGFDYDSVIFAYDNNTIEGMINVHGGITYANTNKQYPIECESIDDSYWIGFDCAHCDDAKDLDSIEDPNIRAIYAHANTGIIRTTEFCINECKRVIDQIINLKIINLKK